MDGIEEEDGHDSEEVHYDVRDEDGREQDHWNANGDEANEVHSDSRSPMLDTIDKLTEPTVCILLDGTMEVELAKVFFLNENRGATPPGNRRNILKEETKLQEKGLTTGPTRD
jgi:hypothetical protein